MDEDAADSDFESLLQFVATLNPNGPDTPFTPAQTSILPTQQLHPNSLTQAQQAVPLPSGTVPPPSFVAPPPVLPAPPVSQQPAPGEHFDRTMDADDDDPFTLQFSRGDDPNEYLNDVVTAGIAKQHSMAPADGGKRMDEKFVATANQGCGKKERKLMNNGLWEKVQGLGAIDPTHHGAGHEDSRMMRFRKAFNKLFPSRSKAERMDEFLSAQQCSILADWLPEFNMLAEECNMKLDMDKAVPQQMLQFINAAPTGFDKRIVRKHRQLISMREYLADLHSEHVMSLKTNGIYRSCLTVL